jgi:hypothetical protein
MPHITLYSVEHIPKMQFSMARVYDPATTQIYREGYRKKPHKRNRTFAAP